MTNSPTSRVDLHVHSTYSEGALTCRQLLEQAQRHGIGLLSLTDHNVIDGVPELVQLAPRFGVEAIPGVEVYVRTSSRNLHLLGYGFRLGGTPLSRALRTVQAEHRHAVEHILIGMQRHGFQLDADRVLNGASRYPGAVHILAELNRSAANRPLIEHLAGSADYATTVHELFGTDRPFALPLHELPAAAAIGMIRESGGVAVLAHPGQQLTFEEDSTILELAAAGLQGIEALTPYHSWRQIEHYLALATQNSLVVTGGSDYHADLPPTLGIRNQWDYFHVPGEVITPLRTLLSIK
ncbi:MAG: PHP domain-containing protein [Patescibacteria group bacterium]